MNHLHQERLSPQTGRRLGGHSIVVIAVSCVKGTTDFDAPDTLEAMKQPEICHREIVAGGSLHIREDK